MSSGGLPPTATPAAFQPGDRVRIQFGMFNRMVGVVVGPAPDCPHQPAVLVRLQIWGRDVDVPIQTRDLEPAPPAG